MGESLGDACDGNSQFMHDAPLEYDQGFRWFWEPICNACPGADPGFGSCRAPTPRGVKALLGRRETVWLIQSGQEGSKSFRGS